MILHVFHKIRDISLAWKLMNDATVTTPHINKAAHELPAIWIASFSKLICI